MSQRTIYITRAGEKKVFPLLSSHLFFLFPSKEVQNRWHHHLGFFQLVRLDLLMKWSLYAMLPMQMCSCTLLYCSHRQETALQWVWYQLHPGECTVWMLRLYIISFPSWSRSRWCFCSDIKWRLSLLFLVAACLNTPIHVLSAAVGKPCSCDCASWCQQLCNHNGMFPAFVFDILSVSV